ncbi:YeaC family protein [Aliidiomarina maris]|uniref:DUF1315 domain-containing protein n=1 Tax=Aliidiomarina maris TaxID=531312 RepID=A0A327WYX0_9GAMM|nr:DUF1315 family protein [Aliidiomarina maris]MBA3987564.1 DUF1315 domain-containing protein [Idiomarina sp.]RAJ98950.1 hypothetical protein B0I24_104154 [Aliidiomarina maris]RUO25093.1 DUF1315 domain-containing protein [Aliidiomarina maris]
MQAEQLVQNMDEALYLRLKDAVETGRWPDGQPLSAEQKEHSFTLVMLYQARKLDQDQPFSIAKDGQFIVKSKAELRQQKSALRESRREQQIPTKDISSDE